MFPSSGGGIEPIRLMDDLNLNPVLPLAVLPFFDALGWRAMKLVISILVLLAVLAVSHLESPLDGGFLGIRWGDSHM